MHVEHKLQSHNHKIQNEKYCTTAGCVEAAAFLKSALEESIDPCKDFYLYSCGGWLQNNPIPDGKINWAIDSVLNAQYLSSMKKLVDNSSLTEKTVGIKAEYQAIQFYRSCMNIKAIDNLGAKPLKDLMKNLGKFRKENIGNEMLKKENLTELLKRYIKYTESAAIFYFIVGVDDKNSASYTIKVLQGGLGLSEFRYKNTSSKVVKAYIKTMAAIVTKLGTEDNLSVDEISSIAQETFEFERKLYKIFVQREERSTVDKFYHKKSLRKLNELVPMIDWLDIVKTIFTGVDVTLTEDEPIIILTLKYFEQLNELLSNTSVRTFENYLLMRVARLYAPFLTQEYIELSKELKIAKTGVYEPLPRWKECLMVTESQMGMALSAIFVKKHFTESSYNKAQTLVTDVRQGFLTRLSRLQWMDEETKNVARKKVHIIKQKIGYPKYILDPKQLNELYEGLSLSDKFFDNILERDRNAHIKSLKKLRKTVDHKEWEMTPVTINAYFSPNLNEIVFTAAIMQPPYFKGDYPLAVNYGSMGSIIGHELTHGFDNDGRQYDASGNFRSWWSESSVEKFKEKAKCFVDEYSSFTLQGLHVKGNVTLGENIADNGGFKAAYEAYKRHIKENGDGPLLPGISKTNEQVFFIAYAQSWCSGSLKSYLLRQINDNEHSPPIERVRGVIRNSPDFGRVFNCPVGSEMNPEKKCSIW